MSGPRTKLTELQEQLLLMAAASSSSAGPALYQHEVLVRVFHLVPQGKHTHRGGRWFRPGDDKKEYSRARTAVSASCARLETLGLATRTTRKGKSGIDLTQAGHDRAAELQQQLQDHG